MGTAASGAPECPVHWVLKSSVSPCGQPLKSQPKCFQQIGQCFCGSGQWLFEVHKARRHSGKSGLTRSNYTKCNGEWRACGLSSTKLQWESNSDFVWIARGLNENNECAVLPSSWAWVPAVEPGEGSWEIVREDKAFGHESCALSHLSCPAALQCLKICKHL